MTSIATGAVVALWWTGVLRFGVLGGVQDLPVLWIDPGVLAKADWAGLKAALFWPVLAYGLVVAAEGVLILARPSAARFLGLLDIALGAALIAAANWLWTASPIAAAIHADGMAGVLRPLSLALHRGVPLPLASLIALILACAAFGGLCRVLRGAWEVLAPEAVMIGTPQHR